MRPVVQRKAVLVGVGALTAVAGVVAALAFALSGTRSTTELDRFSQKVVDGQPVLAGNIVAGRTLSKYHPLPWVGRKLSDVSCPTDLKAVTGTRMTCTGVLPNGHGVPVPVRVDRANAGSVAWSFQR